MGLEGNLTAKQDTVDRAKLKGMDEINGKALIEGLTLRKAWEFIVQL